MQITTHLTKICHYSTENTNWEWTVQWHTIHNTCYCEIHGHRFEIYTLVSEIHENVDLVLGMKNIFELEGVINSRDCRFEFLNRSVPIYPERR